VNFSDDEPLRASQADEAARARWRLLHPVLPDDSFDEDVPAPSRQPWWASALLFSREHVVVVAVALVVGVIFAVMTYQRSRPDPMPAAPQVSISAAQTPEPTPTPTPMVKVHVLGAVAHPGVVTLPEGSRVEDAIAAAGGLSANADPALLNLAAVVADGSQIVIGTLGNPAGEVNGASGGTSGSSGTSNDGTGVKVNINTASETELETLPGIGPVTAGKIIAWRTDNGRFSTVDELQEVSGIGPKTMAQLEPYVTV